jgi:hypothetical protein
MTGSPPFKPETHIARLFLPLNNGSAISYNLCGKSISPLASGDVDKTLKTHTNELVFLKVMNWLNQNQRFDVKWAIEDSEDSLETLGLIIKGATVVDLDGLASMDYKLSVRALKMGEYHLRVEFINKSIQEFLFFRVHLNVNENSSLKDISITSILRKKTSVLAIIENVLNEPVYIPKSSISVENTDDIFLELYNDIEIQPKSEYSLEIFYRPLKIKENHKAKLLINSDQLGLLEYNFNLSSSMDNDKRSIRFESRLGEQACRKFDFLNYAGKDVTFNVKISKLDENLKNSSEPPDFTVESPTFQGKGNSEDSSGTRNVISIFYEPSLIGVSKALLSMTSNEGGDYEILLVGKGQNPTPKGPFNISSKGSTMLEFKNPFFSSKEYHLEFQNSCFVSSIKGILKIDARKSK